jgi:hypothetical protein
MAALAGTLALLLLLAGSASAAGGGHAHGIQDIVHGSHGRNLASTPFKVGLRREKVFGSRSIQRQQHDGQHLNRRQSSSSSSGSNAAAVQLVDEVLANTDSQQQLEMLDLDLILAADSDGDGTVTAANAPAGETNKRVLVTFTTQIDGVQSELRHRSAIQGIHIYMYCRVY